MDIDKRTTMSRGFKLTSLNKLEYSKRIRLNSGNKNEEPNNIKEIDGIKKYDLV